MSNGLQREIMPWPELALTEPTDKTRYRFNWTAPAVVSQHNSNVVYHGGNVLFRTSDRGKTWTPISPDLTRNDKSTQGFGGTPVPTGKLFVPDGSVALNAAVRSLTLPALY